MQVCASTSGFVSHLYVVIGDRYLYLLLVDADFDTAVSSSDYLRVFIPVDFSIDNIDDALKEIISAWQKEIGREIIDCTSDVCLLSPSKDGVGGATFIVSESHYKDGLRSSLLGTEAIKVSSDSVVRSMPGLLDLLSCTDIILVLLNWDKISVFVLESGGPVTDSDSSSDVNPGVKVKEFSIEWNGDVQKVVPSLHNVIGINQNTSDLENMLLNIFTSQPCSNTSSEVEDVMRAYVTSSLFNLQDDCFQRFGMTTGDANLLITGDLASVVPDDQLILAVIDGLQLRGRYEIFVDTENRGVVNFIPVGKKVFPCPIREIYPAGYSYVSTEKGGSGKMGREAFQGKIEYISREDDSKSGVIRQKKENMNYFVGQVGHIYTYDLDGVGKVMLKPAKDVYFPNLVKDGKYLSFDVYDNVDQMIVDCRAIPVVYGPDYEANHARLAQWKSGLSPVRPG